MIPNNIPMHHSTVTCHLSSGQKIIGDSAGYVAGKKYAQELAAKAAVIKIAEMDTSPVPVPFHTQKSAPALVFSARSSSVTSSPQSSLSCKQDLNNYIQHQRKMKLPEYDTIETDKGFVCTVRHALLGKNGVTGSYYKTKKEAENCAAGKALNSLT